VWENTRRPLLATKTKGIREKPTTTTTGTKMVATATTAGPTTKTTKMTKTTKTTKTTTTLNLVDDDDADNEDDGSAYRGRRHKGLLVAPKTVVRGNRWGANVVIAGSGLELVW